MRIGLLTDVYRPGFSGVANHVILLKQSFNNMGHDVRVFAFENKNTAITDKDVLFSPGITVTANYPFGFRLSEQAANAIQTMDILHVHQPFASGHVALQQHKKNGVPLVFTSHTRYDLFSKVYMPYVPTNLSLFAIRRYMRSFSNHLQLMIAPGVEMASMLKDWKVKAPIHVIPNGIDTSAFTKSIDQVANVRSKYLLGQDTFIFLYAGRIAAEKNLIFLIQCFQRVMESTDQAVLVLAGGGPKLQETQDFIHANGLGNKVLMIGPVNYSDMPRYMRAANAFVTVSKSEVHPLTVIEAAATGLPVIGLDAPGVNSIVQNQVTGYLCQENLEEFAQKMMLLVKNRTEAVRLGENAARSAEKYSYHVTAQCVLDEYQSILGKTGRSRQD